MRLGQLFGGPERIEQIEVRLEMQGRAYNRIRDIVTESGVRDLGVVWDEDTVKVAWDFTAEYWGAVRQIRALIAMMDDPDVSFALMRERDGEAILFAELVDALREVQRRLGRLPQ